MSDLLEAALTYAHNGWYVFPCEPPITGNKESGKAPLTRNGKDDATLNELIIRSWWAQWPNANVAISVEPSGLIVLDVDVGPGKKGVESLAAINDQLTQTLTARTGGQGVHAVYQRGDAPARQSLGVRDGIDIIGKGYIIAAPSKHWTGNQYSWIHPVAPVLQPEILKTIQRVGREAREPIAPGTRAIMSDQSSKIVAASLIADSFPAKGTRHFTFLALSGALAQEGWPAEEITEFAQMVAKLIPNTGVAAFADREETARAQAWDSVSKVERGEEVAGWGVLSKYIPQSTIDAVHERLGITNHELDWVASPGQQAAVDALAASAEHFVAENIKNPGILWISDLAEREFPPVVSYPTQFEELNRLLGGGISTQMLQILLGKPGAGKTALFTAIALHLALIGSPHFVPVLYVSTELQHNELVARLASPLLRAPWRDIVRGIATLDDGTVITHKHCAEVLRKYKIAIIAQDAIYQAGEKAVELIARTALAVKEECGVSPVVMVDYLQELARGDDVKARQQNTKVAVTFRMLSQRLDCAFFCVSSVSRAGYGKAAAELRQADNPEVYLALAKESGDIDYAAASIMFLDVGDERDGNGWRMGRMALAKSRHGETGFSGMRFHGAYGIWESFADAVKALSEEARAGGKAEQQIAGLKQRVFGKVRELSLLGSDPNGNSQLKGKTELKALIGGNAVQIGVAIDQMIRDGVIMERSEETQNPITKRITVRKVISLPPDGFTAEPEQPIDVSAALLGIVAGTKV